MKKPIVLVIIVLLFSILISCTSNTPTPPPTSNTNQIATSVAATLTALPSATILPSLTPTPLVTSSLPDGWITYTNSEYGFSFMHPNLFDCQQDCGITGALHGDSQYVTTFAVESSIMWGTDAPFDGFSIDVVLNNDNQSFRDYIEQEKQVLSDHPRYGGLPISETQITVGGQQGIWLSLRPEYTGFDVFYIPLPNSGMILSVSELEASPGRFDGIFNQILSTLTFAE
jgi:hypothetical protein